MGVLFMVGLAIVALIAIITGVIQNAEAQKNNERMAALRERKAALREIKAREEERETRRGKKSRTG